MRGIEKIVNQILEEAYDKQTEILDETHIEVEKINEASAKEISEIKEAAEKDVQQALKQLDELSRLSIEQNKRRSLLLNKQQIIGEILDESYERLMNLDDVKYFEVLSDMLEKFALEEDGEVYLNERDLNRLKQSFKDKIEEVAKKKSVNLVLKEEAKKIDSGFVLVYGGIEENCSFKALIDARKEELQDLMIKTLF